MPCRAADWRVVFEESADVKVGPEIASTTGEVLGKQVTEEELSGLSGGVLLEGQEAEVKPKRHTSFHGA